MNIKRNRQNSKGSTAKNSKFDLEDRLVDFTCRMIDVLEALPNTRTGNYVAGQLVKSCHSPALNYGEAQAAESPADFVHKLCVCLKELKECRIGLKIIIKKQLIKPVKKLGPIYIENEELISIIGKSISTSKKNNGLT
jgi:four helix bundle protein